MLIPPTPEELEALEKIIPEGYQIQGKNNLSLIVAYLVGGCKAYSEERKKLLSKINKLCSKIEKLEEKLELEKYRSGDFDGF